MCNFSIKSSDFYIESTRQNATSATFCHIAPISLKNIKNKSYHLLFFYKQCFKYLF